MSKSSNQIDLKMPLIDHFTEFRKRFIIYLISFLFIFSVCWSYKNLLLKIFTYPLIKSVSINHLIYTKIPELFTSNLEIVFISSIIISIPILIMQIFSFLSPALKKEEKINVIYLTITSYLLFITGIVFAYFIVIPIILKFFLSFQNPNQILSIRLNIEPKISEYISLFKSMLLSFGLAFQLPILLIILVKIGFISIKELRQMRKYAIVFAFMIGAILTPPDVFSQIILAIPLVLLYESSILLMAVMDFNKTLK